MWSQLLPHNVCVIKECWNIKEIRHSLSHTQKNLYCRLVSCEFRTVRHLLVIFTMVSIKCHPMAFSHFSRWDRTEIFRLFARKSFLLCYLYTRIPSGFLFVHKHWFDMNAMIHISWPQNCSHFQDKRSRQNIPKLWEIKISLF